MSAEVTASIMIGPVRTESRHGTPSGRPGERLCTPSHVLVLMENFRATWIMQRCPNLGQPEPRRNIQPSSPRHLLAAALLGYTALAKPEAIESSDRLRTMTAPEPRGRVLTVELLDDDDLVRHIYDYCSEHVYAVVTRLPGSTIAQEELQMASAAGMQIATPRESPPAV